MKRNADHIKEVSVAPEGLRDQPQCPLHGNDLKIDITILSVTSPLNTHTLMREAGVSAVLATEGRKHRATNDAKCKELGWLCH